MLKSSAHNLICAAWLLSVYFPVLRAAEPGEESSGRGSNAVSARVNVDPANELGFTAPSVNGLPAGPVAPREAALRIWTPEADFSDVETARVAANISRLRYSREGRWPLLIWDHPVSAGPELQAWIDRGISPLYNFGIEARPEVWKQMQAQDVPVIFLLQGYTQRLFFEKKSAPAAADGPDPHCLARLTEHPGREGERSRMRALAEALRDQGIRVTAAFIDFEAGLYLRNGLDKEPMVRKEMEKTLACPNCVARYGKDRLGSVAEFRRICDEARADVIRTTFTEPLFEIFPDAMAGNFFAWPIQRYMDANGVLSPAAYDSPGGAYPAYGYGGSGMNVMQPRAYTVPGWQAWGQPEAKLDPRVLDWNVFLYSVQRFSLAARVLEPGEKLVPWIGWLFGHAFGRESALSSGTAEGYREMVVHTLLRGAETLAIFAPEPVTKEFPESFQMDRKELGVFLRNVVDAQAGYDEVLRFQPFLNRSRPLNLEMTGAPNHPGIAWSGHGNDQASLVRTISFADESEQEIYLYGRNVRVPFKKTGTWFWVFPDGTVREIE